jgi:hypothetical protein
MAKQIVKILDDLSPSQMKLRSVSRPPDGLYNMFINEKGQAEKRQGYTKYNTDSIGAAHPIVGLHRFYNESTDTAEFLCAWNTKLYKLASAAGHAATALLSKAATDYTFTADSDTHFANFYAHCYIANGADAVAKYGGTYVRSVGMTVPTAPTFSANIDGSLGTGTYYFKVTYVDEDGYESNGGAASAAMSSLATPNDGITITIPVSTDDKVTKRRIYRTSVGGAIYYYDGEVADNTTTTYNSTQADSSLGSLLHTDHEIPPSGSQLITKRRNRLYLGSGDYLSISDLSDVDYFPSGNFIYTGNRQDITALVEQLNALPVFTQNSIERLVGTDEDNYEFINAFSDKGCYAPRSAVICDNLLIYLSYEGIYYFDGTTSGKFSERLNEYIKDNINYTYIQKAAGIYYNGLYLLSYPKGASTVNSETIYIDLINKTTGVYNFAFSCYSKWDRQGDGNQLYGGSTSIGRVYRIGNDVLTDDTASIACYDKLDPLDFGYPERLKNFYSIFVKCKTTTGTGLKVYYTLDDGSETSVDTPENAVTADKERWYRFRLPGGVRGRQLQIRPYISDAYDCAFEGYMIELEMEAMLL